MRNRDADVAEIVTAAYDYYSRGLSETTLELWLEAMRAYDVADIRRAVSGHLQDPDRGRFPITISDVTSRLFGKAGERAQLAWHKVLEAIRLHGHTADVVFDDPRIHLAVHDCGGWLQLCARPTQELASYTQAAFVKAYQAHASKPLPADYPTLLRGSRAPDEDYRRFGHAIPPPSYVGDPAICDQVLERRIGAAEQRRIAS